MSRKRTDDLEKRAFPDSSLERNTDMGKKKEDKAPSREALCTVHLKKRVKGVPEVVDGKVGEELVCEYLTNLQDTDLVEQVMAIGEKFKTFKDYFAAHVEWIRELRSRIPSSGTGCKIRLVESGGAERLVTWSQFCLEFFNVSADWVRKLSSGFEAAASEPVIDVKETKEGDEKKKDKKPSAEEVEAEYEEKVDRIETQARNLRLELGNLIAKIEKNKDKVPKEVYDAAMAAKFRVVPPKVGDAMATEDESFGKIGTDELKEQMDEVLARAKAAGDDE